MWKDVGDAHIELLDGGRYKALWNTSSDSWFGGLGWDDGISKVVEYSGRYTPDNGTNSYLSLYGHTTNPVVEFYIVESYGSYNPSSGARYIGTYPSDGAVYDLYLTYPRLGGVHGFAQLAEIFYSIRRDKLPHGDVSGRITTPNHFTSWTALGLKLGKLQSMIMATEGYQGSGSADISVRTDPLGCRETGGVPVCCTIAADDDGDGMGEQFAGQVCVVGEGLLLPE